MKSARIFCALVLSCLTSVNAEPEGSRTCRIIYPERPRGAPKFAYLSVEDTSQRVTLPSKNFSEVINLPKGELTILMTPDKLTDFENLPVDLPRLELEESTKDFYIIVSSDPANELLPIRMELVNTSESGFTPGQTLWFNLTDHVISAKMGDSEFTVAPNSREVAKSPVSRSGHYRAEFSYQPEAVGDFRRITEQQWWHDVDSRHLGFIMNSRGELPLIFFFRDFRL